MSVVLRNRSARVAALAVALTMASCGGEPFSELRDGIGPIDPPSYDGASVADAGRRDAVVEIEDAPAAVDSRAYDGGADSEDAYVADSYVLEDSYVIDAYVRDSYVADSYVLDAYVADSYVQDSYVRDSYVCSPTSGAWPCANPFFPYATTSISRPTQYCVDPGSNQPVFADPVPAECQCAETYSCACLRASGAAPCGPVDGSTWSCADGTNGGQAGTITVVCQ